ncbi:hypothetical protein BSY16_3274 [Sinorhizobium sp. RAC02]|nr:hypothetical protein BSY16_3274 [Sinorhizobium sp. RAC02]
MALAPDRRIGEFQMPCAAENQLGGGNCGLGLVTETR